MVQQQESISIISSYIQRRPALNIQRKSLNFPNTSKALMPSHVQKQHSPVSIRADARWLGPLALVNLDTGTAGWCVGSQLGNTGWQLAQPGWGAGVGAQSTGGNDLNKVNKDLQQHACHCVMLLVSFKHLLSLKRRVPPRQARESKQISVPAVVRLCNATPSKPPLACFGSTARLAMRQHYSYTTRMILSL